MRLVKKTMKNTYKFILRSVSKDSLPAFLIIGAQKAGTVSLVRYLTQHKMLICPGEVAYFSSNNYHLGIQWYKKQFPPRLYSTIWFDKTPAYMYYPEAPQRICQFNPDIKLIAVLRNPAERAYSGWNHYRKYFYYQDGHSKDELIQRMISRHGQEKRQPMIDFLNRPEYPSFLESIEKEIDMIKKGVFQYNPSFVRRGIYVEQIKRYYKFFAPEQLLLLESDELKCNTAEALERVFSFLGINDNGVISEVSGTRYHQSNYSNATMTNNESKILYDFYQPYNEELFSLIGKKYDW